MRRERRRGISSLQLILAIGVLFAFTSLGVDLGRVQLAKTELRRVADAAARYGAMGLAKQPSDVRKNAKAVAAQNKVDGRYVALENADIEFGRWDTAARRFAPLAPGSSEVNAVRVTARCAQARGTEVPLTFGAVIGKRSVDLGAYAVALFAPAVDVDLEFTESSNIWLAGMPNGTRANPIPTDPKVRRDRAGAYTDPLGKFHPTGESPGQLAGVAIVPGAVMTFDKISGSGKHGPSQTVVGPDGNTAKIEDNDAGAEHGKSNIKAPIDSVIAVFLNDDVPSGTPPPSLDFSTAASREFTKLSPKLNQVFFIGDGVTSSGVTQQFDVPGGATRLFIGKMDGFEWNNNDGQNKISIHRRATVSLVD